jgi:ABC-type branched-subunit amino acid transport system ATPase component
MVVDLRAKLGDPRYPSPLCYARASIGSFVSRNGAWTTTRLQIMTGVVVSCGGRVSVAETLVEDLVGCQRRRAG